MTSLDQYLQRIKTKKSGDHVYIWCIIRRKWLMLMPEEMVRQAALCHLLDIGYSKRYITVERQIKVNDLHKRYDIVVSDRSGHPFILVECKQPAEPINQSAIEQASIYNLTLTGQYIWVTNGHSHIFWEIDHLTKTNQKIDLLPKS